MLVRAALKVRDLGSDRRALGRRQVPAMQVLRDHEADDGLIALLIGAVPALDPSLGAGQPSIAAVDDTAVPMPPDRLAQAMLDDVVGKLGQRLFVHQREQVGRIVKLGGLWLAGGISRPRHNSSCRGNDVDAKRAWRRSNSGARPGESPTLSVERNSAEKFHGRSGTIAAHLGQRCLGKGDPELLP